MFAKYIYPKLYNPHMAISQQLPQYKLMLRMIYVRSFHFISIMIPPNVLPYVTQ